MTPVRARSCSFAFLPSPERRVPPAPRGRRGGLPAPILRGATFGAILFAATAGAAGPLEGQPVERSRLAELADGAARSGLETYREFLRLPNDARHPEDILEVLAWLEREFGARGFETERLPMPGSDVLLARRPSPGATRTALVYLQADGQPVDPSAWRQESPWEPVLKERSADGGWREIPFERVYGEERDPDWRVFARSASDSKGPIVQFLTAIEAMDRAGLSPALNLKVIVDTEEELGSPQLAEAVGRYRDELAADWLLIFDGPPHASGEPTLTFGARGIATVTLTTYGPRVPQHSGHYGNYAPNPVFRMAEILASVKDALGYVTIPGWYEGITLGPEAREVLAAVPDDEEAIQEQLGIAVPDTVGRSLQEAIQYPSLNVRGIRAAWVGDQARTIIPATCVAEIDVRLVEESDPKRLLRLFRERIAGLGFEVVEGEPTDEQRLRHPKLARFESRIEYTAYRTPLDSDLGRWLSDAFVHLHGEEPIKIRTSGGSIPISPFVATLGVPAVSVPTVNPDNNQHSPDENLRVGDFLEGIRTVMGVLSHPVPSGGEASGRGTGR